MSLLFDLQHELRATAEVVVPGGRHRPDAPVVLTGGATVRGGPGAVLDGRHRVPLLVIDAPGAVVRLEALSFEDAGGPAVQVERGTVEVVGCSFSGGRATKVGGGGVLARLGEVVLRRCVFTENVGRQGGAVLADGAAVVRAYDSLFAFNGAAQGGAVRLREGAVFEALGCSFVKNRALGPGDVDAPGSVFFVGGSSTRSAALRLVNCLVAPLEAAEAVLQRGPFAEVAVHSSWVPESMRAYAGPDSRCGPVALSPSLAPLTQGANADVAAWAAGASVTLDGQPRTAAVGAFNVRAQ